MAGAQVGVRLAAARQLDALRQLKHAGAKRKHVHALRGRARQVAVAQALGRQVPARAHTARHVQHVRVSV